MGLADHTAVDGGGSRDLRSHCPGDRKTLGELAREKFGRAARVGIAILLVALLIANALNVAADLVAIGSGMKMLHAGPEWVWALIVGVGLTALLVTGGYPVIGKVFKVLCLTLLAYVVVLAVAKVPWGKVGTHTLVPHVTVSKDYLSLLVAVLGTTISPYLFFWQTANRVEEMRAEDAGDARPLPLTRRTTPEPNVSSATPVSMCSPAWASPTW